MNSGSRLVQLEWYEHEIAALVGIMRECDARRRGGKHRPFAAPAHSTSNHVDAAGAELAVAKLVNRYWVALVGVNPDLPDVAPDLEVRYSEDAAANLIIRPEDKDDRPYVLVVGKLPDYQVVGWIYGRDGKREEWRSNPGGRGAMYLVPRGELLDLAQIAAGENREAEADAEILRIMREEWLRSEDNSL